MQEKEESMYFYKGWGKSHGNYFFFFDDTSPVGKCDIYRRKDKVWITCVDMNRTDIYVCDPFTYIHEIESLPWLMPQPMYYWNSITELLFFYYNVQLI